MPSPRPSQRAGAVSLASALEVRGALLARSDVALLLRGVLLTLAVAALAAAAVGFYYHDGHALTASLVTLGLLPVLTALLRARHESWAAFGTALLLLSMAIFVVTHGDGLLDVGMLLFPAVIVLSGLLLEQRFSTVMSVLAVLSAVAVGVAHSSGLLHANNGVRAQPRDVLNASIVLIGVAIFVRIMTGTLYRGLHRAFRTEQTRMEIFDAVSEGIAIFASESGQLLDANDEARRMLGFAEDDQETTLGMFAADTETDVQRAKRVLQRIGDNSSWAFEWLRTGSDGRQLRVEVVLKRVLLGGQHCVLAVARDVTERGALREQVREAEQLRALGQLAGGIAHDFNNQLTGIVASASILELELQQHPKLLTHVQMIQRCGLRSADLTRELLAFARRGRGERRSVDCHALVEEVVALLARSIDKRIIIEQRLADAALYTLGDASLLQNAVLNLALNARDAMPGGGHLRISTSIVHVGDAVRPASVPGDLAAGEYVQLSVSDTGMGMDAQTRARIFEPFFTTKAQGHGMGLAAVYGTVQSHGGSIRVDSTLGVGTTFHLFLPLSEPDAEADRDSVVSELLRGSELEGIHVLLADDEPDVADVTAHTLEELGATVDVCTDGRTALNKFRQSPEAFDLVILDQMMPELSGAQALSLIRERRPGVPVLIISGYMGETEQGLLMKADSFLQKPFAVPDLQLVVRKLLKRRLQRANA